MKTAIDDEYQLYRQCKQNDLRAQRAVFDRLYNVMLAVTRRYVLQQEQSEEILADSFMLFFKAIQKHFLFSGKGCMQAYLKRIVINQCISFLRKGNIHTLEITTAENTQQDSEDALSQISADEILACVQQLPPGYRMVFNMYVIEGYSHNEIAEHLGISVSTSKSQLMKAKLQLRKMLPYHG